MNLNEVFRGLSKGQSFKHMLDQGDGWEYVRPTRDSSFFEHTVAGESDGGWGGCAELHINVLLNGCWDAEGWELVES